MKALVVQMPRCYLQPSKDNDNTSVTKIFLCEKTALSNLFLATNSQFPSDMSQTLTISVCTCARRSPRAFCNFGACANITVMSVTVHRSTKVNDHVAVLAVQLRSFTLRFLELYCGIQLSLWTTETFLLYRESLGARFSSKMFRALVGAFQVSKSYFNSKTVVHINNLANLNPRKSVFLPICICAPFST